MTDYHQEREEYNELYEEAYTQSKGEDHGIDDHWLATRMATFAQQKLNEQRTMFEGFIDIAEKVAKKMRGEQ